jgi:two-component system, OmpR family, phosphate regulon sensor histidine kinase PhoR
MMRRTNSQANSGVSASIVGARRRMTGLRKEKDACEFEATLLAMAGHDLRQPLQIIQNVHDRLGDDARTRSELHLLDLGQCAIDRLIEQLNQLVNAVRLREHARRIQLSPVDLRSLLREAYRENEWAALQKGLQVRLVPTASWVMSDAFLLGAVLRNLISNAIKYTEPGGRILLGCRRFQDSVRIDVLDTGIGISAEQMPKIFEAFARLDSTPSEGLGIGLFIVWQAIAMLGHRVDVSSVVSRGTRFSILARRACRPSAKVKRSSNAPCGSDA